MFTDGPPSALAGRNVLIWGLGILGGGTGTARFCAAHGARLRITDLRSREVLAPALAELADIDAEYVLGTHREEDIRWADVVFRNPGVPPTHDLLRLAHELGTPVEMEIAYFARHCPARMYFVTGTKGKTTTTAMLHRFLSASGTDLPMAGNMGQAAMTLLDALSPDDEVLLEVSSQQLEGLADRGAPVRVAVITNVDDDHLDRYGTLSRYRRVKLAIAEGQGPDDWLILPAWDSVLAQEAAPYAAKKVYVCRPGSGERTLPGASATVEIAADAVLWHGDGGSREIARLGELTLAGEHNRINLAFAAAAAYAAGREPSVITSAVAGIKPVRYRFEPVGSHGGVEFVNDSAASAPLAVVAALDALEGRRAVVIAGGVDKAADYATLARRLTEVSAMVVLLPGTATKRLREELDALDHRLTLVEAFSMPEAVESAWQFARTTPDVSVVLLSPGAASFGLFVNEFDRGAQFTACVDRLIATGSAMPQL
jgi:UDP-N-acetylmuramoylalanine--D-glutamate ligase